MSAQPKRLPVPTVGDQFQVILLERKLRIKPPPENRRERGYRIYWTVPRPWRLLAEKLYSVREIEIWLSGYGEGVRE